MENPQEEWGINIEQFILFAWSCRNTSYVIQIKINYEIFQSVLDMFICFKYEQIEEPNRRSDSHHNGTVWRYGCLISFSFHSIGSYLEYKAFFIIH